VWLYNNTFLPSILPAWEHAEVCADAAGQLAICLKAARAAAKVWARRIRAPPQLIPNCKFLIQLFDTFEEDRPLSSHEFQVKKEYPECLVEALKERVAYWKQRSKVRAIREGDSNTAFHHAQATMRMRHNSIKLVEVNGVKISNHEGKTAALTTYFESIIGQPGDNTWSFDVSALFSTCPKPASLSAEFTEQEALQALCSMNRDSAPGPDGFGPGFYRAAWSTVKTQVMQFLSAFHRGEADLERINRTYMVLIPKKPDALSMDAFRPICLQNCSVKILAKIMTSRLQKEISALIDLNQTGFPAGVLHLEDFCFCCRAGSGML
jgi:hypothetical protein